MVQKRITAFLKLSLNMKLIKRKTLVQQFSANISAHCLVHVKACPKQFFNDFQGETLLESLILTTRPFQHVVT